MLRALFILSLSLTLPATAQVATSGPVDIDRIDAVAPEVPFAEAFQGGTISRRKWPHQVGVHLSDPLLPAAATFTADGGARASLRSRTIPLNVGSAVLHYTLAAEPGTAGSFQVDYRDARGRWQRLARRTPQQAVSLADPFVDQKPLPLAALHSEAALRFRAVGLDGFGGWHLLDVRLETFAEQHVLTADVAGPDWGWLHRLDPEGGDWTETPVPFAEAFPFGQQVTLLAPAEIDRWQFNHWTIGEQIEAARYLDMQLDAATAVVAHYWPTLADAALAEIRVESNLAGAVPVQVRLAGGPPLPTSGPGRYALRAGERIEIVPRRLAGRYVFNAWADGVEEAARTVQVRLDRRFRARYVLLGDLNGDGALTGLDVDALILALADPEGYHARFPDLVADRIGDLDGDGLLTEADVDPFVSLFFGPE